jgi:hypothetical protein
VKSRPAAQLVDQGHADESCDFMVARLASVKEETHTPDATLSNALLPEPLNEGFDFELQPGCLRHEAVIHALPVLCFGKTGQFFREAARLLPTRIPTSPS